MSAFIVQDKTINRVVSFLATDQDGGFLRREIQSDLGIDITTEIGQATLGGLMFSLNCDAVNQRYGDHEAESFRPLDYRFRFELCNRLQAFQSLQCWHYQCAEGDIEQTPLYRAMAKVSGSIAEMIVRRLPQYDSLQCWA